MTAPELIDQLSDLGIKLWEEEGELRLKAPKGTISEDIKEQLVKSKKDIINYLKENKEGQYSNFPVVEPDRKNLNESFPLSDIQTAYYVGRDKGFELGNISCHAYYELEAGDIDVQRFETAINKVIDVHDVLRLVFPGKGKQQILESVPEYKVEVDNLKNLNEEEAELKHLSIRNKYSHVVHKADIWPLFKIGIIELKDKKVVYFSFDLMIADFLSAFIIFRDLVKFYENKDYAKKIPEISYRDYVLAENKARNFQPYKKSKDYWLDRLENFSVSPKLPLAKQVSEIKEPVFIRRESFLEADLWYRIKEKAKEYQLTPSAVLLTAYCEVLSKWSQNKDFAINLTLFNRLPVHHEILDISGDFTSVSLLEVQTGRRKSFHEKAVKIQEQLWADMDNRHYSGVNFLRELAKYKGEEGKALMPVVFSSTMGVENQNMLDFDLNKFGSLKYGITQTPQVYLDHQVLEYEGRLYYFWDSMDEIFKPDVLDEMFGCYRNYLNLLGEKNEVWEEVPFERIKPKSCNKIEFAEPDADFEPVLLHELFEKNVEFYKNKDAIIFKDKRLSYEKLNIISENLAAQLIKMGAGPGDLIAISMEKGWEQVAGVLGILKAGCAYLPLDYKNPEKRMEYILNKGSVEIIISQLKLDGEIKIPDGIKKIFIENISEEESKGKRIKPEVTLDETAYVIFTSGSTGDPKGVVIDHKGAVNTILDINKRFGVSSKDKVLALAALNFDLSVYDIFGTLAAGGTIVIPDEEKGNDPGYWKKIVEEESISLWNSVPQLMKMMTDFLDAREKSQLESLKLVMMSGDWLPLDLPDKVLKYFPNASVYSLGGATEASIWSVFYPIKEVKPNWKSIPYGWALGNQGIYVLDSNLEFCPCWAAGEIYISGAGLAKGYLGDSNKTDEFFIIHPQKNIRLYKTGDLGRYFPDGSIEFLGRDDFQVKVNGFRVELGEIESNIKQYPGVKDTVVSVFENSGGKNELAAYFVLDEDTKTPLISNEHSELFALDNLHGKLLSDFEEKKFEYFNKFEGFLYSDFNRHIEQESLKFIRKAILSVGLFNNESTSISFEEIFDKGIVKDKYKKLMFDWISILVKEGYLTEVEQGVYSKNSNFNTNLETSALVKSFDDFEKSAERHNYYLENISNYFQDLLRGKVEPLKLFYNKETILSPENILELLPFSDIMMDSAKDLIVKLIGENKTEDKTRILEIGSQTGNAASSIVKYLDEEKCTYLCSDLSSFFTSKTEDRFKDLSFVESKILNIDKAIEKQDFEPGSFDIIFAANSVHRSQNIETAVDNIKKLLAPGGMLVMIEATVNSWFQKISVKFLQEGFTGYEDLRNIDNQPLLSMDKWKDFLKSKNFENILIPFNNHSKILGHEIILAQAPSKIKKVESFYLKEFLKKNLPAYMIPSEFINIESIPLSSNGKVDRKALPEIKVNKENLHNIDNFNPQNEYEEVLSKILKKILGKEDIGINDNFFEIGGDSLIAVELINEIFGYYNVEISLPELFQSPTIRGMSEVISCSVESCSVEFDEEESMPVIKPDPDSKNLPFPLTEVQQAYWVGRGDVFELGNISTHTYFEIENKGMDPQLLASAWQKVIMRHDMLRAVILCGGEQMILKTVPDYEMEIFDLTEENQETVDIHLDKLRKDMEHEILDAEKWPLFNIKISKYNKDRVRIHLSLDALILDGWSMVVIFRDWYRYYMDINSKLPELEVSYRDYVLADLEFRNSDLYKKDMEYALNRIPDIPPSPDLPMAKSTGSIDKPVFKRFEYILDKSLWDNIKEKAGKFNLTPSGILLAAYAQVLGLWTRNTDFTINLTFFNRLPVHDQVGELVGDFTTLKLLQANANDSENFLDMAEELQKRLWNELGHRYFNGVSYIREISRRNKNMRAAVMPVVFTSFLGIGLNDNDEDAGLGHMGKIIYNVSQTPQVYLDNQVGERDGSLSVNWDVVEELFPENLLNNMFTVYCRLLENLGKKECNWNEIKKINLPDLQQEKRKDFNNTQSSCEKSLLYTKFLENALLHSEKEALITTDKKFTYKELKNICEKIASLLLKQKAKKNSLVAVVMEKGWEEVVAALGITISGAAYLPISAEMPMERIEKILDDGKVEIILTQSKFEKKLNLSQKIKILCVDTMNFDEISSEDFSIERNSSEDLAYVIYTSGSTGMPKGVMIDHAGAVNTISDLNKRFSMNENDKILGLSALNFDLSVFDIFGTLSSGGTIILPDHSLRKDPAHWTELISNHKITIWNSVPMFMQMLSEYSSARNISLESLRLVMMSGDWIPLDLPEKICTFAENAEILSLGGATEASIWSILYPIKNINPQWQSIPYGSPMDNQKIYILNKKLQDLPEWVAGDIFIGGRGVAKGYWGDKEKTDSAFIIHPETGERLYKTGDKGRFLPDNTIEFLGREDFQVKVNGYRVELGEIESSLNIDPGIDRSVTVVCEDNNKSKFLVSYIKPSGTKISDVLTFKSRDIESIDTIVSGIMSNESKNISLLNEKIPENVFSKLRAYIEAKSFETIRQLCSEYSLLDLPDNSEKVSQAIATVGIEPEFEPLVMKWIDLLEKENFDSLFAAEKKYKDINDKFKVILDLLPEYITGKRKLLDLLLSEDSVFGAESLSSLNPAAEYFRNFFSGFVNEVLLHSESEENLEILEIGTRADSVTDDILHIINKQNLKCSYTYSDESGFYLDKASEKKEIFGNFKTKLLNMNLPVEEQNFKKHEFHLIIAYNTLHRASDIYETMQNLKSLLAPGGVVLIMESTKNSNIELLTTALFESGTKSYTDFRSDEDRPLISSDKWMDILSDSGFIKNTKFPSSQENDYLGQNIFIGFGPEVITSVDQGKCRDFLSKRLPEYMIPQQFTIIDSIPLSINGKVDIKKLPAINISVSKEPDTMKRGFPESKTEEKLYEIWKDVLSKDITDIHSNFFDVGGDSLLATRMINLIREEFSIEIPLSAIFEEATIFLLAGKIDSILEDDQDGFEEGEL